MWPQATSADIAAVAVFVHDGIRNLKDQQAQYEASLELRSSTAPAASTGRAASDDPSAFASDGSAVQRITTDGDGWTILAERIRNISGGPDQGATTGVFAVNAEALRGTVLEVQRRLSKEYLHEGQHDNEADLDTIGILCMFCGNPNQPWNTRCYVCNKCMPSDVIDIGGHAVCHPRTSESTSMDALGHQRK